MFSRRQFAWLMLCMLIPAANVKADSAAGKSSQPAAPKKVDPALLPIEDEPGLPRVLLIGDSISIGYTLPVRELLKGKANVHRPLENCGPTKKGVQALDEWLGTGKWDVIHFNFGLHDLRIMNDTKAVQVSLDDYEKNLNTIVERLKKTNAKLIWRNTTPVPQGAAARVPGTENQYNEVAARVMKAHQIPIQDLHAFVLPKMDSLMLPKNVHFTPEGSRALAEQVVSVIEPALPKKP